MWWVFQQMWDQDLVYEGYKVLPFSTRLGTVLSNFEANLNYKDVQDPAITVRFAAEGEEQVFFIAWTTTPWTLPSNLALAVGSDIDYVKVRDHADKVGYIMAEARLKTYFPKEDSYTIEARYRGKDLAGRTFTPLFPYFVDQKEAGAFRVIESEHVTTEDGTGIVHMAPAFGEEDFYACQQAGIPLVNPVDDDGRFYPGRQGFCRPARQRSRPQNHSAAQTGKTARSPGHDPAQLSILLAERDPAHL